MVRKLIAERTGGKELTNAIDHVKEYNSKGVHCSLSFLPVRANNEKIVDKNVKEYLKILDRIHKKKLDCDVTLKLHQFGAYVSKDLAEKAVTRIVKHANKRKIVVWIDMESNVTTDMTIEIFNNIYKKYKNAGICLQAYRKRTEEDMRDLLKKKVRMRLVKGFYHGCDFKTWDEVTRNYSKLMEYLLLHSKHPAIATHDLKLIAKAKRLIKKHKIKNAEFQFFKGVRDDLAEKLAKQGFNVRIYIPYGDIYQFIIKGILTFDISRHAQRLLEFSRFPLRPRPCSRHPLPLGRRRVAFTVRFPAAGAAPTCSGWRDCAGATPPHPPG